MSDAFFGTAPLSANSVHLFGIWLGDDGIIKKKVSGFVKVNIVSHRPPELTIRDALSIQQTVELIMTIGVAMISKVRLGEVLKTS